MKCSRYAVCGMLMLGACAQLNAPRDSSSDEQNGALPAPSVSPAEPSPAGAPASVGNLGASGPSAGAVSQDIAPAGPLLFAVDEDAGSRDDASVQVMLDGPTTVLVVLDRSGSMGEPWSDGQTRWVAANQALIAALAPASAQLTIGAVLFPVPGECAVAEIDGVGQYGFVPGPEFIDTWKATMGRDAVGGSTPLELAFSVADRTIAGASALLEQHFVVVVITDGEPTCGDDLEAIERYPAAWLARGIETSVMGLPGSEPASALLERIAKAGGTEHFQQIGTPDQLTTAVAAVL